MKRHSTFTRRPAYDFYEILLRNWMPAAITAVIGGFTLAFLVPYVQTSYANKTAITQRQVQVWENIALHFTHYINARTRLNAAAQGEAKLPAGQAPSPEFVKRKEEYRAQRDEANILLRNELLKAEFYFGEDVKQVIDEYIRWHAKFTVATLDQLPPESDYLDWRRKILTAIGTKLKTTLETK